MRNKKQLLILLVLMLPVISLFSFDPSSLNRVTFINKTGADIWYVFLSPGDSNDWGFDILGSERVLENNNLLSFYVSYPDYSNDFDIMAIDENGDTFILYDKEFSDEEEISILITEGDQEDNLEMDFIEVEFENQTEYELLYLFVSPSDSNMWGVDMMDDEQTILPYDTLGLLAPYTDETVSYDVMAVDEDLDKYQFTLNVNYDYSDDDGVIRIPIEMSDFTE